MEPDELRDALAVAATRYVPETTRARDAVSARARQYRTRRRVATAVATTLCLASLVGFVAIAAHDNGRVGISAHQPTTPTTISSNSTLVPSPYGFLAPRGWRLTKLTGYGGPASYARFTDPNGIGSIDYVVSGGEFGSIYTPDGKPDIHGALTLLGCTIEASSSTSATRATATCRPDHDGVAMAGAIVVKPKPEGWKAILVSVPRSQQAMATAIIRSFR
jgi:hypothetical protein